MKLIDRVLQHSARRLCVTWLRVGTTIITTRATTISTSSTTGSFTTCIGTRGTITAQDFIGSFTGVAQDFIEGFGGVGELCEKFPEVSQKFLHHS